MAYRSVTTLSAALLIGLAAAAPAEAGQKAGQWDIVMKMTVKGLPDEQMEEMKKAGLDGMFTGKPNAIKQCVSPAQAAAGRFFDGDQSGCTYVNKSVTASQISADMVCTGDLKGKGHMQISLAGDASFTGGWKIDGIDQDDNKLHEEIDYTGKWTKAACDADAQP